MANPQQILQAAPTPFSLDDDDLYRRWRDQKLEDYPRGLGDLLMEIKNPEP